MWMEADRKSYVSAGQTITIVSMAAGLEVRVWYGGVSLQLDHIQVVDYRW